MDIDRGILKALFYDYPIDALVQLLNSRTDMQYDEFLDIMPQLLQWSKPEYTRTEANLLRLQIGGEWKENTLNDFSTLYHPCDVLKKLTPQLLSIENDTPVVQFEQLFRWKESALYVGEDLLVTAFLAQYDALNGKPMRDNFLWDDIIKHNHRVLNDELRNPKADLHAHYNATVDVFNLNWIGLMNDIRQRQCFAKKVKCSQELELLPLQSAYPSTLQQHCVAAAYLRFVFFKLLLEKQSYKSYANEEWIENNYQQKVVRMLTTPYYADDMVRPLQTSISVALQTSMPTIDGQHVDYCLLPIKQIYQNANAMQRAQILFQGERQLLYQFFYGYYLREPNCVYSAPYFYLYLLLKSKIRREFVQINQIKGFENFEIYQSRKDSFLSDNSPIIRHYAYQMSHTSVNPFTDCLEVRVTPKNVAKSDFDCTKPMFFIENVNDVTVQQPNPLNIVVHFIKEGQYDYGVPTAKTKVGKLKDGTRDEKFRKKIKDELNMILPYVQSKRIVGIDAASSELFCRPETFGHVFRYAYTRGIQGRTFHAGEDFLDLPDGLRAIDEAMLFLQLDSKCRIGHAMALGIDAKAYYERRHFTAIITMQNMLDNCVWLYMRSKELNVTLSPRIEFAILEKTKELYSKIGYSVIWDIQCYWHSMLLRGNDPQYIGNASNQQSHGMNLWDMTAEVNDSRLSAANVDANAKILYSEYFYNPSIKNRGLQLIEYKWGREIIEVVTVMQNKIQNFVSEKGISIECCPTSNLKIGYIDKYENHPLIKKFYPIDEKPNYPFIKCSINTDDRGVFYTSLYEEYSLIALALKKKRDDDTNKRLYNDETIINYISKIRKNALLMAF